MARPLAPEIEHQLKVVAAQSPSKLLVWKKLALSYFLGILVSSSLSTFRMMTAVKTAFLF
jgi:hypothetical protein